MLLTILLLGVDIRSLQSNFAHQHSTATGSKLLNYSMEQFFYPHLSLTVRSRAWTQKSWTRFSPIILATWALVIASLLAMHRLGNEIQRMGRIMENYSAIVGAGWNDVPEPVTITTMAYTTTGTKRWFAEDPTPSSDSFTPTVPISTSPIPTDTQKTSAPSPIETHTNHETDASSLPPESMSAAERYALLPIQHILTFSWPVHDFHSTVEKVMQTIDKVWQMFRKVYHYPLDPT